MNPDTNRFEELRYGPGPDAPIDDTAMRDKLGELQAAIEREQAKLLRPDGSPVPAHWPVFRIGEHVVIKDYTFKVAYIGEKSLLFEPVGIPEVGKK